MTRTMQAAEQMPPNEGAFYLTIRVVESIEGQPGGLAHLDVENRTLQIVPALLADPVLLAQTVAHEVGHLQMAVRFQPGVKLQKSEG